MKKDKKSRFTHVFFAVTFAIGISVFSTPAVAEIDIRATVPVSLRSIHPDVVECWMVVDLGSRKGPQLDPWYARGVTQLDYDPSGNGSFDGDVVVTIDLRQVVDRGITNFHPLEEPRSGRISDYAYEDLKAENFTHYKVNIHVVHSNGEGKNMSLNDPAWAKCEEGIGNMKEIVKEPPGTTLSR